VTTRVSVKFEADVDIATEPVDGVYPVRIEPFGIATFGRNPSDAVAMAEDAMASYLSSLIERGILLEEFDRLGVAHQERRVVTRDVSPYVEIDDTASHPRPARGQLVLAR
jgi:hypothetical protein